MAQPKLSNEDPTAPMQTEGAFSEVAGTRAPPTDQFAEMFGTHF